MQGLRTEKKRKATLAKRKRTLYRREDYQNLELLIKKDDGNCSTYYIPVKTIKVIRGRGKLVRRHVALKQDFTTPDSWKIVDSSTNIVVPQALVDKRISLKKGNISVNGIVLSAKPVCKGPEGNPVPTPPPPINRGNSSE